MTVGRDIDIGVPTLTRVEGEGALHVRVEDGELTDLRLRIYEPPRFFEALLSGRGQEEPIDITARICGICPVAYQMSAATALERISSVSVDGALRDLRRLLYAGEWIESHTLHIALLHAPDFLDAASGIELAGRHPDLVRRVLGLKQLGNELMEVVGGRPIHPVNVRLGGFHRAPEAGELTQLLARFDEARDVAVEMTRWVAGFEFPDASLDHELVSLRHESEYPMLDGRLVSDRGLDIAVDEFDGVFEEVQVPHSTAIHARRRSGETYLSGPLARWANNVDRVPSLVADLAHELDVPRVERNPFRSIVIRSLEVVLAIEEARRLIESYVRPTIGAVDVPPCRGVGWGATEAPRGVLLHRYETAEDGTIEHARIIPPTAQNLRAIELDVGAVVRRFLHHDPDGPDDELRRLCETAIRNHDPCISCATHFLRLEVER